MINIGQVIRGTISDCNKKELRPGALVCAYGKGDTGMEKDSLVADGRVIRYQASGARKGAARPNFKVAIWKMKKGRGYLLEMSSDWFGSFPSLRGFFTSYKLQ